MSSTDLPALAIDVSARRSERVVAVALSALALLAVSRLGLSAAPLAILCACMAIALGFGFLSLGWLGGRRRLVRIVCQSDGRWVLCEAGGRTVPADLSPATRVSSHALWLRWDARPGRPMLLIPSDVLDTDFRRLSVRLRLMPIRNRDIR